MSLVTITNLTAGKLGISPPPGVLDPGGLSFVLNPNGSPGDSKTVDVTAAALFENAEINKLLKPPAKITVVVADDPNMANQLEELTKSGAAADDALVVHKAGVESITGVKTFTAAPLVPVPAAAGNPVRDDDPRNTNARTPTAHAVDHEDTGADEIDVTGLSGLLADPQTPTAHAVDHEPGGADAVSNVGYAAAMPAFWVGPPPATTKDALDRLVAYLQAAGPALPGGPIP
jgi:hypothetical protein